MEIEKLNGNRSRECEYIFSNITQTPVHIVLLDVIPYSTPLVVHISNREYMGSSNT